MLRIPVIIGIIVLVVIAGVGLYVTDFTAYLGNEPSTCNNCHVMDYVYEGWFHNGHKLWTTCNDCHTPHALIPKYFVKAQSGYHHVTAFLFKEIPDAIRAKESSRKVVQENCIRCHTSTVEMILENKASLYGEMDSDRYCFECHRSTAHGERGVSILPYRQYEENK
jgi:cytochrome c nitrite reductase small subunit